MMGKGKKTELVRLLHGPAGGVIQAPLKSKEVSVWNEHGLVAVYRRTALSIVEKDTMLPVFKYRVK